MKKIGILGGTFDPIHKGHIELAKKAKKLFGLGKIVVVPSGIPPHKRGRKITDKEERFSMVTAAIKTLPDFSASRIELDRKGYSYAVDTFIELKKKFGKDAAFYYIMGLDSINDILNWKKPLELFKMTSFIVAARPGNKIKTFKRLMKFPPLKNNMDKIHFFEMKMDMSSSEIRKKIKRGEPVKDLLPKEVEEHIKRKKLYK